MPQCLRFAIYAPGSAELPWLAVVLAGDRPVGMFGCPDREIAERLLRDMRAVRCSSLAEDAAASSRGTPVVLRQGAWQGLWSFGEMAHFAIDTRASPTRPLPPLSFRGTVFLIAVLICTVFWAVIVTLALWL